MDTMTTALKKAILRDGRLQAEIADVSGVDRAVLSRFVRDERTLTLTTADRIVAGLGLECWLVRRKGR